MSAEPSPPTASYAFDPELAELAAMAVTVAPTDAVETRERAQAMMAALRGDVDTSTLDIDDRQIPGPQGAPPVTVRVYVPHTRAATPTPAVLYIHGGGFFMGTLDSEHAGPATMATTLGIVVVSVDYRLAPEHPYPAGLDDCFAALDWMHRSAEALQLDTTRIAVNGGSAGGGLAAAVALRARDLDGPPICFQYLGIPELDDRLDTPSMRRFVDTPMWSRPAAEKSWEWYLGDLHHGDVPYLAAPARATDLSGLPPAYVSVMEFDPLRDEGLDYACRMLAAGVSVELHCFPGTFHGSAMVQTAAVHRREAAERLAVWKKALRLT
ncbi:MAG: Esterase [Ilumatobacteraceae bacterium]|nr:Esterase [Ilumatobacteraceae bacterium]